MNNDQANNAEYEIGYVRPIDDNTEHLRFDLRGDGRLVITATRGFWAAFSIEVSSMQYQFGFYGERQSQDVIGGLRLRRFLSVNPTTGVPTYNKIRVNTATRTLVEVDRSIVSAFVAAGQGAQAQAYVAEIAAVNLIIRGQNARAISGGQTAVLTTKFDFAGNPHVPDHRRELITLTGKASLFSTLERRVALEVGCSLPIKNSPMIDHQKETPDFVLSRWIWKTNGRLESNDRGGSRRYHGILPACIEYQGPQDRVTYHELQAQQKIQVLRLRLFARVRTFNFKDEIWSMRVVDLPTSSTDWWHARLHFVSKD
jgi:hypothetical protein